MFSTLQPSALHLLHMNRFAKSPLHSLSFIIMNALPCRQGRSQPREPLARTTDGLVLIIGMVLLTVPLARNTCFGMDDASLAPVGALRSFPCEGSLAARGLFLVKKLPIIILDLLSVRGPHDWMTLPALLWFLRAVSHFCLPCDLYATVIAPLLTYVIRACPIVAGLAAGPNSTLSSAVKHSVFNVLAFLDLFLYYTQPACRPVFEALYSTLTLTAVVRLASWHELPVGQVILRYVAIISLAHFLAWLCRGYTAVANVRATQRRPGPPALPPPSITNIEVPQLPVPITLRTTAADKLQTADKSSSSTAAAATVNAKVPCSCLGEDCRNDQPHSPAIATNPVIPPTDITTTIATAPLTATPQMPRSPPPYRSLIRRHTTRVKIPFAEPEQLPPDYMARLEQLAKAKGLHLAGVYVRAGCIELIMDVEDLGGAWDEQGGGDPLWDVEELVRALGLQHPPPAPHLQEDAALTTSPSALSGLQAVTSADEQSTSHPTSAAAAAAGVSCQTVILGSGGPRPTPVATPGLLPQVRVELQPQVLLRPAGGEAEAARWGLQVRLSVRTSHSHAGNMGVMGSGQAQALGCPPSEVLVRGPGGGLLPARLLTGTGGFAGGGEVAAAASGGGGGGPAEAAGAGARRRQGGEELAVYHVEVVGWPVVPGALLVELRWGDTLHPATPLLVLQDAAVVQELTSVLADWRGPAIADHASHDNAGLDNFLLDLGAWSTVVATATAAATSSHCASPVPTSNPSLRPLPDSSNLPPPDLTGLAAHLLRHADACDMSCTAAAIRSDLAALNLPDVPNRCAAAAAAAGGSDVSAIALPMVAGAFMSPSFSIVQPTQQQQQKHLTTVGATAVKDSEIATGEIGHHQGAFNAAAGDGNVVRGKRQSKPRSLFLSCLARAAGWEVAPKEEEADYRAFAEPLVLAHAQLIQAVEVLSLVALLFRARHQPLLSPANATTMIGCLSGTLTAAAWGLLPRRRWEALVNAVKIPRYVLYMMAKIMIGHLGFPAPPGLTNYQLGPAMLIMEGVLLPGSCLLSPRNALIMALVKWPPAVSMILASRATRHLPTAVAITGRVVLMSVITTLACHTYLRLKYNRWVAAKRSGGGMGGGVGAVRGYGTCSSSAAAGGKYKVA